MTSEPNSPVRSEDDVRRLTLAEKKEILRRFGERVDAAMAASPPTKAWVKQALSRGGAPRCATRLRRLTHDIILRYGDALADLFCQYPDDVYFGQFHDLFVGYQPPDRPNPVDPVAALTETTEWTDEWGTVWKHSVDGVGASTVSNAIADWSELDRFLAHQMPNPRAPGRSDGALPALKAHGDTRYFAGMSHFALFERQHNLRGIENTFADFHQYPEEVDRLLGALTEYYLELVRLWGQLSKVDAVFLTDDWGTQLSLMISPPMWRKFFAARYRRICEEAHRFGMHVVFHSCGNVTQIVGDLIDAGIDVLDPLQPEAMDLAHVAREYGGKVAFCGGVNDQQLAVVTPQQVKDQVRRAIDTLGVPFGNAYVVAPSNMMGPDIRLENLEALFEAAHNP